MQIQHITRSGADSGRTGDRAQVPVRTQPLSALPAQGLFSHPHVDAGFRSAPVAGAVRPAYTGLFQEASGPLRTG
ncbi:hypothetical protein [Lentzea jiangxiensis]|uniref:Uncharacterized protein n=1 Tax=Lentzea jiangxiensis TaxID=641025 RepID=A0A1H0LED5_9PSEU|nr:hypothetical protein [Lentzea jiangxiensis]SDO66475.1 hypothetical protein SAMN05421507_103288 [Lentzea jiangxiensis]